jgi:SET domain-containing protein
MKLNFAKDSSEFFLENTDKLEVFYKEEDEDFIKKNNINPNERFEKNTYYQAKKIIVKMSRPEFGLGVFATEDINTGELIERCPLIELEWRSKYVKDAKLVKYVYTNSGCPCNECKKHGPLMFLAAGYGMLYNHQNTPNTKWDFNFKNLFADLIATKDIKNGEEIFVHYGNSYFKEYSKSLIDK